MGTIADATSRFAQPLIDATYGSQDELQRALPLSQLCWNLALTPEGDRDQMLADIQPTLKMDDEEFQEVTDNVVMPMIRRHKEMFPAMRRLRAAGRFHSMRSRPRSPLAPQNSVKKYAGTGRSERGPCGSAKKYKV